MDSQGLLQREAQSPCKDDVKPRSDRGFFIGALFIECPGTHLLSQSCVAAISKNPHVLFIHSGFSKSLRLVLKQQVSFETLELNVPDNFVADKGFFTHVDPRSNPHMGLPSVSHPDI